MIRRPATHLPVPNPGTRHRLLTTDNQQLDIHITDTVRQTAVFTFRTPDNSTHHSLCAPIETALKLDRTVRACSEIPSRDDVAWDFVYYQTLIAAAKSPANTQNEDQ